jgi:uncharacterized protein (DUF488 family)
LADYVFTIGHSTHSAGKLIDLLAKHNVNALADVRSQPYSRINPQFNKENLRAELQTAGISYVFLGRELGARSEDRSCYVDNRVQYDLLARTALFQEGLTRIAQGISTHRIALMCAEKDPLACHRAILVCRHLVARGIEAQHILEDGRLEGHEHALTRLLSELGLAQRELFWNRDELIAEAYSRRAEQIAYSVKQTASEETIREVRS